MFASPFKDSIIVLVVLLLFFGPKRLPLLSRSIGESIKEFKGGIGTSSSSEDDGSKLPSAERPETVPAREPAEAGSERSA